MNEHVIILKHERLPKKNARLYEFWLQNFLGVLRPPPFFWPVLLEAFRSSRQNARSREFWLQNFLGVLRPPPFFWPVLLEAFRSSRHSNLSFLKASRRCLPLS